MNCETKTEEKVTLKQENDNATNVSKPQINLTGPTSFVCIHKHHSSCLKLCIANHTYMCVNTVDEAYT